MGKKNIMLISKLSKIQYTPSVNLQLKKRIGIVIPHFDFELIQEEKLPAYTFNDTSHYLDDLIIILKDFFQVLLRFAEVEDLMLKLSINFKKINRRINGLKNLIMPRLKSSIKEIKGILEEMEREGYVRLKKTKDLIINKKK
jgi:V/A-type H+-transporting ATPase subunit D